MELSALRALPLAAFFLFAAACDGESRSGQNGEGNVGGASDHPVELPGAAAGSGAVPGDFGSAGEAGTENVGAAGAGAMQEPEVATFAAVQSRILSNCSGGFFSCHGRDPFDAELDLTAGKAYAALVGRPAFVDASVLLVKPGDAEQSLLWRKLTAELPGDGSLGARMPIESSWQPTAGDLDLLRRWIDDGAAP